MYRALYLRADTVTEGECTEKLVKLAKQTVEDYFVAPPGKSLQLNSFNTYICVPTLVIFVLLILYIYGLLDSPILPRGKQLKY